MTALSPQTITIQVKTFELFHIQLKLMEKDAKQERGLAKDPSKRD